MKKLYLFTIFLSLFAQAQFTKIKDLTLPDSPGMYMYANEYNTWNGQLIYVTVLSDGSANINATDGTAAGTRTVYNITKPTPTTTISVNSYKKAGNGLYIKFNMINTSPFQQYDEVWFTDGTPGNTVQITTQARVNLGGLYAAGNIENFQRPYQASHVGNTFYFWKTLSLTAGASLFLFKSDGTAAGTQQVTGDVHIPYDNDLADEFWDPGLTYNDNYYFLAQDISSNLVRSKFYKLNSSTPELLATFTKAERMGTVFKNKIYFMASKVFLPNPGNVEREIFWSDGTAAGTDVYVNFQGDNGGNGVNRQDHFTFQKTDSYLFIRHNNNLLNNVVVTDGNPNNIVPIYSGSAYPATNFYVDNQAAYFLKRSNDTNTYPSTMVDMTNLSQTSIATPFFNTVNGVVLNGTLWLPNKPSYSGYIVTPYKSSGNATLNTNGYNHANYLFALNGVLHGFSNYFNSFLALYRFEPNYIFTNAGGNNLWNTATNWQAKTVPLNFDDAEIPAGFAPVVDGNAGVRNFSTSSPLSLSGNLSVSGVLTLNSKIGLNNNSLILKGSTSQILYGNSINYLMTNGSGAVTIESLGAERGTVQIPVGTANSFNPVTLQNSGTSDSFSVSVAEGIANTSNGAVNATWDISEGTAGGSNVNLTLGWNQSQEGTGFNRSSAKVGHFVNGVWTEENSGSVSGSDPYSLTATGITAFSPFGVMNFGALATAEVRNSSVHVYPNPFSNYLQVEMEENGTLTLFDASGKVIDVAMVKKGNNRLEMGVMPAGLYHYALKNIKGGTIASGKLLKN